jgi:uncharacterized membrane protein YphA (DoxX/SURF4 family)
MPGGSELTLILLALFIIPSIFYLITLQKTLEAVTPANRKMPPGQVWLLLIPLFNYIWQFFTVSNIADSIKLECERLNIPVSEERPTYNIGLTKNILSLCVFIPFFGGLASLAFIVCWIIYWVKVNEYKKLINANKDNDILDAEQGIFYDTKNV